MNLKYLATLLFTGAATFTAPSIFASDTFSAEISEGNVTATSPYCREKKCPTSTAELTGMFDVTITGDVITFSNIAVSAQDLGFSLPENPNSAAGGTVNSATFTFDGEILSVQGTVDQRAFDGPLYSYNFEASVIEPWAQKFDQKNYFLATQDFRKCVSPLCGGIFIQKVNRHAMRCPDGRFKKSCYVGEFDWHKIGRNPFEVATANTAILLKGKPTKSKDKSFGNVGRFEAEAAFQQFGDHIAYKGHYAGLRNNGIVCITTPCFSFDRLPLNSHRKSKLSGINFSQLDIDKNVLEQAQQRMANGEAVIAFGTTQRVKDFAGPGLEFLIQSLFMPINATIKIEPKNTKKVTVTHH